MFKKLTVMLSILGVSAAMVMSAFASAPSAEEILTNCAQAAADTSEVNAACDVKADVTIDLPDMDTTFGLQAGGSLNAQAITDPLSLHLDGNLSFSAMGEGGDYAIDAYVVTEEDGTLSAYGNLNDGTEDSGWQYSSLGADEITEAANLVENAKSYDITQLPIDYVVADDTVDVNGHTCYELNAILTWDEIMACLPALKEAAGDAAEELPSDEELAEVGALFEGIRINVQVYIDTETYKTIRTRIDPEGSDWTILSSVFASYAGLTNEDGSLMNVNISVSELYIEYNCSDEPVDFTVPDEALAAKDNGEVLDGDVFELLSEVTEG